MSRPHQAAVGADRRETPRLLTELAGRVFPGGVSCAILDLSVGGARIYMAEPCRTGDDVLLVEWDSGRAHDGQVVWADGDELGVRFLRSFCLQDRTPAPFAEAKQAWETAQRLIEAEPQA